MKHDDAELIERTLEGDQHAFATLVEKYQEQIHALAWQKIGDFHIAQEITQDAFITAYQKLATLTHHNRFAGWLYVITCNECNMWHRKKKPQLQSLEETDPMELEEVYYSEYVSRQREEAANQNRRTIVRKLLNKLRESERTVVTMHYLAGLTCEEIGKFLGVSPNTVKSRLHRARERLKKEEAVIQENLSSFQLPTQFTENIMKEISRLNPIAPSGSKPLVPLAMSAAAAIFVILLMGVGAQNLIHFQEPYQLDATSESMIEIVDTQYVLDTSAKPALRNQIGRSDVTGKSNGAGQKPDTLLFAASPADETEISKSKRQWVQTKGPEGGAVNMLFVTSQGDLYAGTVTDLYRLMDGGRRWNLISSNVSFKGSWQMMERGDTFYVVSDTEVFASTDRGKTWNSLGVRPEGKLIGTMITDDAFYLGLADGVYHSEDGGTSWIPLNDGLEDRKIRALAAIENTVFVGTDSGLYRLKLEEWEQLLVGGKVENIRALASAGHRLYVAIGEEVKNQLTSHFLSMMTTRKTSKSLFRSTDLGDSWQAIEPEKVLPMKMNRVTVGTVIFSTSNDSETEPTSSIKIAAFQESLMVIDRGSSYYSSDTGETWITLDSSFSDADNPPVVAMLNENIFYSGGKDGIYRTTDAGKTWHQLNTGLVNTFIMNLVVVHDILYANIGQEFVTSSDGGESWTHVLGRTEGVMGMVESNGVLYVRGSKKMAPHLFRLSANNRVTPIPEMPIFEAPDFGELMDEKIGKALLATLQEEAKKTLEEGKQINPEHFDADKFNEIYSKIVEENLNKSFQFSFGSFAVSGTTYYMESDQKLFRWKHGTSEWYDTGLVDEGESGPVNGVFDDFNSIGFKVAVSGDTVYVGKRDGHLMLSFDEGDIWNDVTTNLPFSIERFKAITFAGQTVYVATDKGVMRSSNGIDWYTLTDAEGTPLVVDRFAVDGTTVYSQVKRKIYQIKEDSNTWQQVTPEIPYHVNCFDVDGNTLYVGTFGRGVLRYTLDE